MSEGGKFTIGRKPSSEFIAIDIDPRAQEDEAASKFLANVKDTLTARAGTYPAYSDEAHKVAGIWNHLFPESMMTAQQVPAFMMVVKLVRDAGGNSPDSLIDLCGYAARKAGMR